MSTPHSSGEEARSKTQRNPSFRPFEGIVCPGIAFETGHVIWLLKFDSTPTPIGSYSEVWIKTPDGESTVYADPPEADEYISAYHDFDSIRGADLDWAVSEEKIRVTVDGEDGKSLHLNINLNHTTGTKVMEGVARFTPDEALQTELGNTISSLSFDLFMGSNGTKLRGQTETGAHYWAAGNRLRAIRSAAATLDGTGLGRQVSPSSTRHYGDISTARDPYVVFGTLHLEYPAPGHPDSGEPS